MKQVLYIAFLLLTGISYAQSPKGTVRGRVTSSDGQPAAFVTVTLKGTNRGSLTDEAGQFTIKNIPTGSQTLLISLIGYRPEEQVVEVRAGETVTATVSLAETAQQLQEIVVTVNANKFANKETDYVARMPLKNLENPQVYNVVTKELAQEQVAVSVSNMLKNVPGAARAASFTNGFTAVNLRGFDQQPQFRNGMMAYNYVVTDVANIERLEVIKGPAAALFASIPRSVNYGGIINRVTKQPYSTFGGEVSLQAGSYDLQRFAVDINTPLNSDGTALFRLNAAAHRENSFQDFAFQKTVFVAPSFLFKLSDRLSVSVDAEFIDRKANFAFAPTLAAGVTASGWNTIGLDYYKSYLSPELINESASYTVFAEANYQLSPHWRSQTAYSFAKVDRYRYDWINPTLLDNSRMVRFLGSSSGFEPQNVNVQQNFIGDFKLGRMRNRLIAGIDYNKYREIFPAHSITHRLDTINVITNKNASTGLPARYVSRQDFDNRIVNNGRNGFINNYKSTSVYVSDVFDITNWLNIMGSLRFESIDNETLIFAGTGANSANKTETLSPKLGVVIKPFGDKMALFANYNNAFRNIVGVDAQGNPFKVEQANQIEGGIKAELNRVITATISYYDIEVTNSTRTDVANPSFQIQDGTRISKGTEIEVIANPLPGLNIVGGYGYNHSEFTKSNENVLGKRPANVANHLANFWVSYRFLTGKPNGLVVGFGGNYSSDAYQNDTNTFIIPAYTLLDATVGCDRPRYRLNLKVNNLANEKTWSRLGPQPLRQLVASLTVKF